MCFLILTPIYCKIFCDIKVELGTTKPPLFVNLFEARKQKILSREMKTAPTFYITMSHFLKDDLGLQAYKRRTCHFLTDNLKIE